MPVIQKQKVAKKACCAKAASAPPVGAPNGAYLTTDASRCWQLRRAQVLWTLTPGLGLWVARLVTLRFSNVLSDALRPVTEWCVLV